MRAIFSFAPSPRIAVKRLPLSLTPRSKSSHPSASPSSKCCLGAKSNVRGSSTFLIQTFSFSSAPIGTSSSMIFGTHAAIASKLCSRSFKSSLRLWIFCLFSSSCDFSAPTSLPSRAARPSSLLFAFCTAWRFSSSVFLDFSSL